MSGPGRRDRPAAWWSASLRAGPIFDLLHRWSGPLAWSTAGLALGGCVEMLEQARADEMRAELERQEQRGWNFGGEGQPLVFPGAQDLDILGRAGWRDAMTTLALRLSPTNGRFVPYYNPTLFQSLEAPRNADLRAVMRPILTPEMTLAWRRGDGLRALLTRTGACRPDVALVLDLDGPDAVAAAAALAPCFDPVFVLANWPHPLGVVAAHHTLGAALYFLPSFDGQRPIRPPTAPPAFVLDRQRLAPYADDAGRFDNRYLAGLPPVENLRAAGIAHLLYVTPDDQVTLEADDLNDDLVAIDQGGIDVKLLALSDFAASPLPGWPQIPSCSPPASPSPLPLPLPPPGPVAVAPGPSGQPRYFFGGSPEAESCFAFWYGWQSEAPPAAPGGPPAPAAPQLPLPSPPQAWYGTSLTIPPRLGPRCHFHPTPRATFSLSGGWRGGWHGGFGHPGGGFHRSGSMGRGHFGGFG